MKDDHWSILFVELTLGRLDPRLWGPGQLGPRQSGPWAQLSSVRGPLFRFFKADSRTSNRWALGPNWAFKTQREVPRESFIPCWRGIPSPFTLFEDRANISFCENEYATQTSKNITINSEPQIVGGLRTEKSLVASKVTIYWLRSSLLDAWIVKTDIQCIQCILHIDS